MADTQNWAAYAARNNLYYVKEIASRYSFFRIVDVTIDTNNNKLYVCDSNNNSIVEVSLTSPETVTSSISTQAPAGLAYHGDKLYVANGSSITPYTYSSESWGSGTAITGFNCPQGMVFDSLGNLFVADAVKNAVYKVVANTSTPILVAGSGNGTSGFRDGTGTFAKFKTPTGLAIYQTGDNDSILYVMDSGNNCIRKIDSNSGEVITLAGGSTPAFQDGTGASALFNNTCRAVCDSFGNLFAADTNSCAIRMVTPAGVVHTICTRGLSYNAETGQGSQMNISFHPCALTMNPTTGVLYTAQSNTLYSITPNYIGPGTVASVADQHMFGSYPIIFAGGILKMTQNITLSNPIILEADSLIDANGHKLTLTGTVTGSGSLYKLGGGSVTGAPGSSYIKSTLDTSDTSVLNISSGTTKSFTNSTKVAIISGGTLTIDASMTNSYLPIICFSGGTLQFTAPCSLYGTLYLAGNGTIDCNEHNVDLQIHICGTSGLTFTGDGTITINNVEPNDSHNNACLYTGSTTISAGGAGSSGTTVKAGDGANLFANSNSVTVNGTFGMNYSNQVINDLTGSGTIRDSSDSNVTLILNAISASTFSGTFDSSVGGVVVQGWAPLSLTGDNSSYPNGITVQNGILNISNTSALGSGGLAIGPGILQLGADFTYSNTIALYDNMIIDTCTHSIDLSGANITDNEYTIACVGGGTVTFPASFAGAVVHASSGKLTFGTDTLLLSGPLSVTDASALGRVFFYPSNNGTPTLQATGNPTSFNNALHLITNGTIDTNGTTLTHTGVIDGTGSLTITSSTGNGTLILQGVNTYKGDTTVNANATLQIYDSRNLGTGQLTLNKGTLMAAAPLTITQDIALNGDSTLDTCGFDVILSGKINLNTYKLTINNGGKITTLSDITSTGSGISDIVLSNGGAFTSEGLYTDSASDYIQADDGCTLNMTSNTSLPSNVHLGSGSVLKITGSGFTLPAITVG